MKSSRHHYLPKFYIKGFVNSRGKVFVYDKIDRAIKKVEFSPKQVFYEWNRNTLEINGEKDDFLEGLYGSLESAISPSYNRIAKQTGKIDYDPEDLFHLFLLISLTFWRSPINDSMVEDFVELIPNDKLFIKIFDKTTGKEADDKTYEELRSLPAFLHMYRLARPAIDYMLLDVKEEIVNWAIYSGMSDKKLHLLGDNPILFKEKSRANILENELIFPLTSGSSLVHTKGRKRKLVNPENKVRVDLLIFIQSERYVVGPDKQYLQMISALSHEYDSESKVDYLRKEIFENLVD
ncbi:MAG: DUF4238 domain-containing protein [Cyanobacteria bacterium J06649_11]